MEDDEMKKSTFTKIFSVVFATVLAFSVGGCDLFVLRPTPPNPKPGPRPYPLRSTRLLISNYQGGYGRAWLDNAIARFEIEYQNYEFEPGSGKKGIQLYVDSSINGKTGYTYLEGVTNTDFDLHFTEDTFYYDLIDLGAGADITDIVVGPLMNYDETRSIEDKMDKTVKDFFGVKQGKNTSYYALPHYFTYDTLYYDVDIFDMCGLWMKADGTFLCDDLEWMGAVYNGQVKNGEVTKEEFNLSKGIDGDNGTEFDGLPATYDEFFKLLDKMLAVGVEPIHTYGSGVPMNKLFYSAWAQNEGRESFLQTVNPTGTSNRLIADIAEDGTPTLMPKGTAVDGKNVQAQLGKYQALQFAKRLARGSTDVPYYFHDYAFSWAENYVTSMGTYIFSKHEEEKPVAFYMADISWENFATEAQYMDECKDLYGEGRYERKFGVLPMPFADESYLDGNQKWTMPSSSNFSLAFINKNLETDPSKAHRLNAAKMFLQFLHTDEELQNFSVQTSGLKPFNYDMPEKKLQDMSYYGQQIVSLVSNPNVDIVYSLSKNDEYIQHYEYFYHGQIGWGEHDLMRAFFNTPDKTVAEIFWELKTERNSAWDEFVNNT